MGIKKWAVLMVLFTAMIASCGDDGDGDGEKEVKLEGCGGAIGFPDPVMENAVRAEANVAAEEDITSADVKDLVWLEIMETALMDISGLQCLTGLEKALATVTLPRWSPLRL